VELRQELPEYNKLLVGSATLLVRQLEAPPPAAPAPAAARRPAEGGAEGER